MTRVLNSERVEPLSGVLRSIVVFLHGYGANGADLLGLAQPLGDQLPDTLFCSAGCPRDYSRHANGTAMVSNTMD